MHSCARRAVIEHHVQLRVVTRDVVLEHALHQIVEGQLGVLCQRTNYRCGLRAQHDAARRGGFSATGISPDYLRNALVLFDFLTCHRASVDLFTELVNNQY